MNCKTATDILTPAWITQRKEICAYLQRNKKGENCKFNPSHICCVKIDDLLSLASLGEEDYKVKIKQVISTGYYLTISFNMEYGCAYKITHKGISICADITDRNFSLLSKYNFNINRFTLSALIV